MSQGIKRLKIDEELGAVKEPITTEGGNIMTFCDWVTETHNNSADCDYAKSCTIFEVPRNIKDIHRGSFNPKIISIGPFHYGKKKKMDEHKWRYLHRLFRLKYAHNKEKKVNGSTSAGEKVHAGHSTSAGEEVHAGHILDIYNGLVEQMIQLVRKTKRCYSKSSDVNKWPCDGLKLNDKEFAEMMVIDGCFITELLRVFNRSKEEVADDPVFTNPWMLHTLQRDLLKLENQLPFFVVEKLFELTSLEDVTQLPLVHRVVWFFNPLLKRENPIDRLTHKDKYDHMLDVFRCTFISSVSNRNMGSVQKRAYAVKHLYHSATELEEIGIGFIKRKHEEFYDLLDIDFIGGNLEIPSMCINDSTVPIFLNFVAFEQCHNTAKPFFSNFFLYLDSLVNLEKDVEVLHRNGIINHTLGSNENVANLFNKLGREIVYSFDVCYISKQIDQINELCTKYYDSSRRQCWRHMIRRYFSSPWSFISLCAAVILLVLTALQTFYTIKN